MHPSIFNREPRPYIMIRLACKSCGPVRMALVPQDQPITAVECPYCFVDATAEPIGTGQTLRNLPYFEVEGSLVAERRPPQMGQFVRLVAGQLVVYCEEESILHLAAISNVFTNRMNLSPEGVPSISFVIGGEETAPVPHISSAPDCPPYWCLPSEVRGTPGMKKAKHQKK